MYKTVTTALQNHTLKQALSLLVFLICGVWLWFKLDGSLPASGLPDTVSVPLVLPVFALTFANLFCETQKWRILVGTGLVDLPTAFRGILLGICAGILTPNRAGEFIGRVVVLNRKNRKRGALMTFAGSALQGGVTLVAGSVALIVFPLDQLGAWTGGFNPVVGYVAFAVAVVVAVVLMFSRYTRRSFRKVLLALRRLTHRQILTATGYGVLRYSIFSVQFALMLYACGYRGSLATCFAGIALVYLIQSYVPLTGFGEIGVREVITLFVFGNFLPDPALAVAASLLVWSANIGMPVLAGIIITKFRKIRLPGNH